MTKRISKKAKKIATSGCVTHKAERTWIPLLPEGSVRVP
jgi:hypothetical protein